MFLEVFISKALKAYFLQVRILKKLAGKGGPDESRSSAPKNEKRLAVNEAHFYTKKYTTSA